MEATETVQRRAAGRLEALQEFWEEFKKDRLGVAGLILLLIYLFMATFAPWIAPFDPSPLNRVGADFAAPGLLATLDPTALPSGNQLQNGEFESLDGWSVQVDHPELVSSQIVPGFSGNSLQLTINDPDSGTAGSGTVSLLTDVEWSQNAEPPEVHIRQRIRTVFSGDYEFGDFDIHVVAVPHDYGNYTPFEYLQVLQEKKLLIPLTDVKDYGIRIDSVSSERTEWDRVVFNPNSAEIGVAFQPETNFQFGYVIEYDLSAEATGSFSLFLDDVELDVFAEYHGVMGTTNTGADVFSQLVWGSRPSLLIGIAATAISVSLGLTVGLVAGYFMGSIDELLMRIVDFLIIIPFLPLLIVFAVVFGRNINTIIIAIGILGWTGTARLIRSQVLSEREKAYVDAATAVGASDPYIIFRHVLPNVIPLIFVQLSTGVASAILAEVGLSFLGLGPTQVTWGRMLQAAFQSSAGVRGAWWFVVFPGIAVGLLAMAFIFVGYSMNRILNPRLRAL